MNIKMDISLAVIAKIKSVQSSGCMYVLVRSTHCHPLGLTSWENLMQLGFLCNNEAIKFFLRLQDALGFNSSVHACDLYVKAQTIIQKRFADCYTSISYIIAISLK